MMDTERLKETKEMEQLEILLSNGYGMETDKRNLWNERRKSILRFILVI